MTRSPRPPSPQASWLPRTSVRSPRRRNRRAASWPRNPRPPPVPRRRRPPLPAPRPRPRPPAPAVWTTSHRLHRTGHVRAPCGLECCRVGTGGRDGDRVTGPATSPSRTRPENRSPGCAPSRRPGTGAPSVPYQTLDAVDPGHPAGSRRAAPRTGPTQFKGSASSKGAAVYGALTIDSSGVPAAGKGRPAAVLGPNARGRACHHLRDGPGPGC